MQTDFVGLTRPLPPLQTKAIKFSLARLFIRTIGHLSKGIEIGCAYGFDSGVMFWTMSMTTKPKGAF
jgi:hypothetical protein